MRKERVIFLDGKIRCAQGKTRTGKYGIQRVIRFCSKG